MTSSWVAGRATGKEYKVRSSKAYHKLLVSRSDVTLWLEKDVSLG
ncbi:hypothetical protein [Posidoniimonas corsicana]|nr:hypothetical protein [Posidoniimonas corsicana]